MVKMQKVTTLQKVMNIKQAENKTYLKTKTKKIKQVILLIIKQWKLINRVWCDHHRQCTCMHSTTTPRKHPVFQQCEQQQKTTTSTPIRPPIFPPFFLYIISISYHHNPLPSMYIQCARAMRYGNLCWDWVFLAKQNSKKNSLELHLWKKKEKKKQ